jgi:hypothetical protein
MPKNYTKCKYNMNGLSCQAPVVIGELCNKHWQELEGEEYEVLEDNEPIDGEI